MNIIDYKDLTPELARAGCFVLNMPNEEYHAYDAINKSGLDKIDKSPAHYLAASSEPPTQAMLTGTAVHTAVLEPERFAQEYQILVGINDKRKSEYKEAVKAHGKERVLTESEAANIITLIEAISHHEDASLLLANCDLFEVSAFVEWPSAGGVLLKCRYDALSTKLKMAVDLKTTQCSRRDEFSKSVFNYRYHVQDGFYSKVYELITGEPLVSFKFLAVEPKPPHCPMVYNLDEEAKMIGSLTALANLEAYVKALKTNEWKGYEDSKEPLSLPNWALAQLDTEVDEGIYL